MANLRILLADDHTILRAGLQMLVEAQPDMEVVGQASNGHEAVRLAQIQQPDVLVMDISMPELGGIEATEQIQQHCPRVRVLVLTRHSDQGHLRRLLQAGARGYLVKKTAPAELIAAIRSVAAGGLYLDPTLTDPLVASIARSESREAQPASPVAQAMLAGAITQREQAVLRLFAWGRSAQEIATELSISSKTVDYHKTRASEKLGLRNRTDIVRYALSQGWLQADEAPDEP